MTNKGHCHGTLNLVYFNGNFRELIRQGQPGLKVNMTTGPLSCDLQLLDCGGVCT